VRGIFLNEDTGGYAITYYPKDNYIIVCHASLGRGPFPMERQALMVYLDHEPKQVYVTCALAE
jgi:hypothetical protein